MEKTNMEIFQQALEDAVSCQFDDLVAACDEEIVFSERHLLAMHAIVYGKADTGRTRSLGMKRVIAILIAAALLLTGCGIIFRHEIREVFNEFFVSLRYECTDESDKTIKDVYVLGYVPEGYVLEKEVVGKTLVKYEYANEDGETLYFEQRDLAFSSYYVDSESGYSQIKEIEEYEVYYRFTNKYHHYVFRIDSNSVTIKSSVQLSNEDVVTILDEIAIK